MGEARGVNTDRFITIIRWTMLAGALYDLLFAVPILAAPGAVAPVLRIPMPEQEVYLRFLGVFLAGLAIFYLLPVVRPGRYLGNVAAAAVTRAMGGVYMLAAVLLYGQARAFLLLGAGDLFFAVLHVLTLLPFTGLRVWTAAGLDLAPRRPAR